MYLKNANIWIPSNLKVLEFKRKFVLHLYTKLKQFHLITHEYCLLN